MLAKHCTCASRLRSLSSDETAGEFRIGDTWEGGGGEEVREEPGDAAFADVGVEPI